MGTLSTLLGKRYGLEVTIGIFAALVVTANIIAVKLIPLAPEQPLLLVGVEVMPIVPAAVLAYSTTFLITDILNEKWGKEAAHKAVWIGFLANLVVVISIFLAAGWPAATYSPVDFDTFSNVFGLLPQVVIGSMVAYLISQHFDVWAFDKIKKKTKGKHLWLRNNGSTIISQAIDSIIFLSIAFYGVLPFNIILGMIVMHWLVKLSIALIDTPFFYISCHLIDKYGTKKSKK